MDHQNGVLYKLQPYRVQDNAVNEAMITLLQHGVTGATSNHAPTVLAIIITYITNGTQGEIDKLQ